MPRAGSVTQSHRRHVRLAGKIGRRLRAAQQSEGRWPIAYIQDVSALISVIKRTDVAFKRYWTRDEFDSLVHAAADARAFLLRLPKEERGDG